MIGHGYTLLHYGEQAVHQESVTQCVAHINLRFDPSLETIHVLRLPFSMLPEHSDLYRQVRQ